MSFNLHREITKPNLDAMEKILEHWFEHNPIHGPYTNSEATFVRELFASIKAKLLPEETPKEEAPKKKRMLLGIGF